MILKKESVLFAWFVHFRPDLQRLQTFRGWEENQLYKHLTFYYVIIQKTQTHCEEFDLIPQTFVEQQKLCEEFVVPPGDVQPRSGQVVSCLFRGERGSLIGPRSIHKIRRTRMYKQEHTPIKRLQRGRPCHENSSECCWRCLCVCLWWGPFGSKGPCSALGVLIRQPQPSRVHDRKREKGGWGWGG